MYFDTFYNIIKVAGELINETPLAIRTGTQAIGAIDNPIVRIKGVPYIPGSSLKGALRSEAERYARSIGEKICDIINPNGPDGELKLKEKLNEEYIPCIICRLFGGPTIFSRIKFYDMFPLNGIYKTSLIQRVSINRITEAQTPGRLFDVEFIEPGTRFDFRLEIENFKEEEQKEADILKFIVKHLIEGNISLGGMKSVGFGKIRLLKNTVNVKEYKLKNGELVENVITSSFLSGLLK